MEKDITKRLSKSKINSYLTCPKKYWFEQNFPEKFVTNEAMQRGSELHQIFEDLYTKPANLSDDKIKFKETIMKLDNSNKYVDQVNKFIDWQEQFKFMKPESVEKKIYDAEEDLVVMWDRVDFDGKKRCLLYLYEK